jgi:hypothetical protein
MQHADRPEISTKNGNARGSLSFPSDINHIAVNERKLGCRKQRAAAGGPKLAEVWACRRSGRRRGLTHASRPLAASGRYPQSACGASHPRCRCLRSSRSDGLLPASMFGPSPCRWRAATTASAVICTPSRRLAAPVAHRSRRSGAEQQTSQGKTRDLRAIYLSHLRPHPPGDIGLRVFAPPRPDADASYALPVRQAGTLLTASFRSQVAPGTLAVRLAVPITRARRGLPPPSHRPATTPAKRASRHPRHAWRTQKAPPHSGGAKLRFCCAVSYSLMSRATWWSLGSTMTTWSCAIT